MSKELIERAQNSFADDAADRVLISDMADRIEQLEAERDELLEVVKHLRSILPNEVWAERAKQMCDAAIAKGEK